MKKRYSSPLRFLLLLLIFISLQLSADDLTGVKISWKAPTEYSNGEPLKYPKIELKEYRLYYGPSRGEVRSHSISIDSKELSFPLEKIDFSRVPSPVVYFAMTAVAKTGLESDLSEITFFLP
jgi:hypothetical protein